MAHPFLPVFGVLFTGWTALLGLICTSAMMFVLAVLIYRLRPAGWWLAVVSMTIGAASYLFTLARHDLAEIYAAMQTPPEQIELMRNSPLSGSRFTLIFSLLGYIVCMGYALYVRRYFSKASVDAFKASTR